MNDKFTWKEWHSLIDKAERVLNKKGCMTDDEIETLRRWEIEILEANVDRRDIPINVYIDIRDKAQLLKQLSQKNKKTKRRKKA